MFSNNINLDKIKTKYKPGINLKNNEGITILHKAASEGNIPIINFFLSKGIDIDIRENNYNYTPLHFAVIYGKLNMVKHLINKGAKINSVNINIINSLYLAVGFNYLKIIEFLLKNKANVNIVIQPSRDTPLHIASSNGNINIIKLLLQYGANKKARNNYNYLPINKSNNNNIKNLLK